MCEPGKVSLDYVKLLDLFQIYFGAAELSDLRQRISDGNPGFTSTADGSFSAALQTVSTYLADQCRLQCFLSTDHQLQVLSCSAQILRRLAFQQPVPEKHDLVTVKLLVDALICSGSSNEYLLQTCQAIGLSLFGEMQQDFFQSSTVSLSQKLDVICCMLDEHVDGCTEASISLVVRDILLDFSAAPFNLILYFFINCIQVNRRDDLLDQLVVHQWKKLELFLDGFIVSRHSPTSDLVLWNDFFTWLNAILDYAEDMSDLRVSLDHQEIYTSFAKWIISQNFLAFAVSQLDGVVRFAAIDRSPSCSCRSVRKPLLLILKSCCILARQPQPFEGFRPSMENVCLCLEQIYLRRCATHVDIIKVRARYMCTVFGNDDEGLSCVILCLLHLHMILLEASPLLKLLPTPKEAFDGLTELLSGDRYVLVSWITDNQNCFLAYFLQYLKYIDSLNDLSKFTNQVSVFTGIRSTLSRLHSVGDVAFNPTPLLRRLSCVLDKLAFASSKEA